MPIPGKENLIPETGGAYVIGTAETMLIYPCGTSPIFYMASSEGLYPELR